MDPQPNTTPGLGLPQPSSEMRQVTSVNSSLLDSSSAVSQPGFGASAPAMMPPIAGATPMQQPFDHQPAAIAAPGMPLQSVGQDDESAHDSTLDNEWVNKAKEVVERTHTDPYIQSRELGKIKVQYIKARYNKDIKISEQT